MLGDKEGGGVFDKCAPSSFLPGRLRICEGRLHVNLAPTAKMLGQAPNADQLSDHDWAAVWSFLEPAMRVLRPAGRAVIRSLAEARVPTFDLLCFDAPF